MYEFNCEKAVTEGLCKHAECCGLFPIQRTLYLKNQHKIQVPYKNELAFGEFIIFSTDDLRCIFIDREKDRCMIYHERPNLCRLFGRTEGLLCPCMRPDGTFRIRQERRALRRTLDKGMVQKINGLKRTIKKTAPDELDRMLETEEYKWYQRIIGNNPADLQKLLTVVKE